MLGTLLIVLILIAAGVAVLMIGITGSVSGTSLSAGKRLAMLAVGIGTLALAYYLYRQPEQASPFSANKGWNAMPSTPPENRGAAAQESVSEAAAPRVSTGKPAEPVVAEATAEAAPDAPADAPKAEPLAAPAVASSAPASSPAPADGSGLSASAAEIEAAQQSSSTRRTPREELVSAEAPASAESPVSRVAPAQAAADSEPAAVARPARRPSSNRAVAGERRYRSSFPDPRSSGFSAEVYSAGALTIHIRDELGERQTRERLHLMIEGKRVASFTVDEDQPGIRLPVPLPRPGLLHYRLEGEARGEGRTYLVGEGCIEALDGARFEVRRHPGSRRVFLESSSGSSSASANADDRYSSFASIDGSSR